MSFVRWLAKERLAAVLTAGLVLAVVTPVGPGPISAVPLAVAVLAVAVCLAACSLFVRRPTLTPAGWPTARIDLERSPVRQCDPDSAGHVRPRAPGSAR
jgi:hypothetical protein